jgi:hypothetical protein
MITITRRQESLIQDKQSFHFTDTAHSWSGWYSIDSPTTRILNNDEGRVWDGNGTLESGFHSSIINLLNEWMELYLMTSDKGKGVQETARHRELGFIHTQTQHTV